MNAKTPKSKFDAASGISGYASGHARVGPAKALPSLLEEFGASPHEAFAMTGISPLAFADDNNRIPYDQFGCLLDSCVQLTQCEHFCLLLGERFDLSGLGPIGELMRHSPTVGDALRSLAQCLHLHDQGAAPVLVAVDNHCALLGYSVYRHGTPATARIYDLAISIAYRILCQLCGPQWAPLRVQFSRKQPRDTTPYRKLFRSPVHFDAGISGVVFSSASMQQPIAGGDPILYSKLLKDIQDEDARSFPLFKDRVQRVLRQMLLSGTFSGQAIAHLFNIHERTLRRHLSNEGTHLQILMNQTRFELAKELLQNTALPVAEIAFALQYDDANAFSRAFRSWADLSPNQWRKAR